MSLQLCKYMARIDDMKEIPHLICGKTAVGGNYNLTRDSIAVKIKKSAGALKHRRTQTVDKAPSCEGAFLVS